MTNGNGENLSPPEEEITNHIIRIIKNAKSDGKTLPWRKPWKNGGIGPVKVWRPDYYMGKVNRIVLTYTQMAFEYRYNIWGTKHQWTQLHAKIGEDERPTPIVWYLPAWRFIPPENSKDGEPTYINLQRVYHVYNLDQVRFPRRKKYPLRVRRRIALFENLTNTTFSPIESGDKILHSYQHCPPIQFGHAEAAYSPLPDVVQMPRPIQFNSPEDYYQTLFHEIVHSTGHPSRLGRASLCEYLDSEMYSEEELVAEFGASILCGELGLEFNLETPAGYINFWLEQLENDPRIMWRAIYMAHVAVTYIKTNSIPRNWMRSTRLSSRYDHMASRGLVDRRSIEIEAPHPLLYRKWNPINVTFPAQLFPEVPHEIHTVGNQEVDFERREIRRPRGNLLVRVKARNMDLDLEKNEFQVHLREGEQLETRFHVSPRKRKKRQKILLVVFDLDDPKLPKVGTANLNVRVGQRAGELTLDHIYMELTPEQVRLYNIQRTAEEAVRKCLSNVLEDRVGEGWLEIWLQEMEDKYKKIVKRQGELQRATDRLGHLEAVHYVSALTWADYVEIFGHRSFLEHFKAVFGKELKMFRKVLDLARDWRNYIAHQNWLAVNVNLARRNFNYVIETLRAVCSVC